MTVHPSKQQPLRPIRLCASDGLELVGDEAGPRGAPTVVLMHGGGQTRASWSGIVPALVDRGYRVVNYDARGHGDSGWSAEGRYGIPVRADDLRTILADIADPFALVGASMGGATAMRAIQDGITPAALILVDIVLRPDPAGVQRIFDFMSANPDGFASLQDVAEAIARYNPHRPRSSNIEGLKRNLRQGVDGRYYWHWDPRILAGATRDADVLAGIVAAPGWTAGLRVMLVRGAQSDIVGSDGVDHMRQLFPQLEVMEVPGAGHMVAGDRNDAFSAGVIAYLDRIMPVG